MNGKKVIICVMALCAFAMQLNAQQTDTIKHTPAVLKYKLGPDTTITIKRSFVELGFSFGYADAHQLEFTSTSGKAITAEEHHVPMDLTISGNLRGWWPVSNKWALGLYEAVSYSGSIDNNYYYIGKGETGIQGLEGYTLSGTSDENHFRFAIGFSALYKPAERFSVSAGVGANMGLDYGLMSGVARNGSNVVLIHNAGAIEWEAGAIGIDTHIDLRLEFSKGCIFSLMFGYNNNLLGLGEANPSLTDYTAFEDMTVTLSPHHFSLMFGFSTQIESITKTTKSKNIKNFFHQFQEEL